MDRRIVAAVVLRALDMQVRERNMAEARATAAMLAEDFPDNPELRKFLEAPVPSASP